MGLISQKTIEQIKNAADILDVVGEFVALQPAGKNHKGLCPFHNEKTPSFFVSKERNSFHCFGCGEKGDAITFVMKYKNLAYVESLRYLAERYNIAIETDVFEPQQANIDRYYRINEEALQFYALHLTNLEKGQDALAYLRSRDLDIHTIQYFEIGYAPRELDALYQYLKTKYEEIDLLSIGLIKKTETGYIDLFRDRIIFPIKNELGKVVGFSGRTFAGGFDEPKYVNSPYTEIFTKGEVVYNLDKAQTFIRKEKRITLYEGYMDVIASVKAGVKDAVCSMGTQLTPRQAALLKRYADKVLLCYDGDAAGFEATAKAATILEEAGLSVQVVLLPDGLDPDDFVKKNSAKAFQEYLAKQQLDLYDFRYLFMTRGVDLKKPSAIESLKARLFDFLITENSGSISEIFIARLAEDCKVTYESLREDFNNYRLTKAIHLQQKQRRATKIDQPIIKAGEAAENILINYCLNSEAFRNRLADLLSPGFWLDSLNRQIAVEIETLAADSPQLLTRSTIITRFSAGTRDKVANRLFAEGYEYNDTEFSQCVTTIRIRDVEYELADIKDRMDLIENISAEKLQLANRRTELHKIRQDLKAEQKRKPNGQKRNHQ